MGEQRIFRGLSNKRLEGLRQCKQDVFGGRGELMERIGQQRPFILEM